MPRKVKDNGGLIYKTGKWLREEEEILKTNARVSLPALTLITNKFINSWMPDNFV